MLVAVSKPRTRPERAAARGAGKTGSSLSTTRSSRSSVIASRPGSTTPGLQIPSEHELGRELKVSRVTIREALRELVRENLLVKVQGKGTFVAPELPKVLQPIKYNGFLEDLYQRVQQLEVVNVDMARVPVTDKVRTVLHLPASDQRRSSRSSAAGTAKGSRSPSRSTICRSRSARASIRRCSRPCRSTRCSSAISRSRSCAPRKPSKPRPANPEVAEQLGIPVLYPVMHVTRVMFTDGDRAFEVVETFYRADKYHYSGQPDAA